MLCHIADTSATRTDSHLLLTRHTRDGISVRLDGCAIQFLFLGRPTNKHLEVTNRLVGASCKYPSWLASQLQLQLAVAATTVERLYATSGLRHNS